MYSGQSKCNGWLDLHRFHPHHDDENCPKNGLHGRMFHFLLNGLRWIQLGCLKPLDVYESDLEE